MSRIIRIVKEMFTKHPMIVNSTVYGTMTVTAEYSQQILTKRILIKTDPPEPLDIDEIRRYGIMGTFISPNIFYFWYKWLDRVFAGTVPKVILKKIIVDQFILTPPYYVFFFVVLSLLKGKKDLFEECKQKFIPTFKTSCMFWIPVQAINFMLVPPAARVICIGMCSFVWINIFCWMRRNELKTVKEE